MYRKECVAMLLAGGQGSRLSALTSSMAKPAVPFGAKYRIIDFTLSNCCHSGIDTVGVLTQYRPLELTHYLGAGGAWNMERKSGGLHILAPYMKESGGEWYSGTADAIYQNMDFLERFSPRFVLILSGDHIYKMNYSLMLDYHKAAEAAVTIGVVEVPLTEANRFGIVNTGSNDRIVGFEEKPDYPAGNLASMGIYLFNYATLLTYLRQDGLSAQSSHDFGKDIIPAMLQGGESLYAYPFQGYWRDVGTVNSYWQASMDLLAGKKGLDVYDPEWPVYSAGQSGPPHYIGSSGQVDGSFIGDGCQVFGKVENSILSANVYIGEGTTVRNSVLLPNARVEAGALVEQAIIGYDSVVDAGCQVISPGEYSNEVVLLASNHGF